MLGLSASDAEARGAQFYGSLAGTSSRAPNAAMAAKPSGDGYWLVSSTGIVHAYGAARLFGSMAGNHVSGRIVDIAPTSSGRGYWLFGSDGAVYNFGDAAWKGAMRDTGVSSPIVAGVATPTDNGYWLFGSDGAVYALGDARWHGSMRRRGLSAPVVGAIASASGDGYLIAGRDGAVYRFGDARWYGGMKGRATNGRIVDIARTPSGYGYWLVSELGSIYHFGNAAFRGSMGRKLMLSPVVSMVAARGGGYWFTSRDGAVYSASAEGTFVVDPNSMAIRLEKMAAEIYFRINTERAARGLRLLQWDPRLVRYASQWATWMGTTGDFDHSNLAALFDNPDYATRYRSLRENIFNGTGDWRTSGAAHLSLMNSDPHRKTILMPELTSVGIGVACLNGRLWVAQEFGVWIDQPAPQPRSTPPRDPIAAGDMNGLSC